MNRCKHCGKEIPEYKVFCNKSCSAKYNNVHRTRKPWTEEQRKKFSRKRYILSGKNPDGKRYCRYCQKELDKNNGEWHVCRECLPYVSGLPVQAKLGIVEGSLKFRDEKAFNILKEMYFQENLGTIGIARKTGIRHVSLLSLFRRHGIDKIRTVSEGLQESILAGHFTTKNVCPKYKSGYYTTWEGKKIYYRSSYELEYAQNLDSQKIKYEYESIRIKYFDTIRQRERVAVPDFYLPDTNEIVEIKSKWTLDEQNMKDKFKAYRDSGYNPILILDKKQIEF